MSKDIVFLLGLPRSGTTLVTAMLDVNPEVGAVFEPWNVTKDNELPVWSTDDDIVKWARERTGFDYAEKKCLVVKETAAHKSALEWSLASIRSLEDNGYKVSVIWLIRDIDHVYLSRIQAAREWWGHTESAVKAESFREFIQFSWDRLGMIEEIFRDTNSITLSYEGLLLKPNKVLSSVMSFIGLDMDSKQLEYHLHFKNTKSAGDQHVTKSPSKPSSSGIGKRDLEWNGYKDELLSMLKDEQFFRYVSMHSFILRVRALGVVRKEDSLFLINKFRF